MPPPVLTPLGPVCGAGISCGLERITCRCSVSPSLSPLLRLFSLFYQPPPPSLPPLHPSSETGGESGNERTPPCPRTDATTKRRDSLESSMAPRSSLSLPPGPSPSNGVGALAAPGHQQGSAGQAGEGAAGLVASLAARQCARRNPGPAPAESPGRVRGYPACFTHSEWTPPSVSMRTISLALTPHWPRVAIRVGPSAGQTVPKSFGGRTGSVRDPR